MKETTSRNRRRRVPLTAQRSSKLRHVSKFAESLCSRMGEISPYRCMKQDIRKCKSLDSREHAQMSSQSCEFADSIANLKAILPYILTASEEYMLEIVFWVFDSENRCWARSVTPKEMERRSVCSFDMLARRRERTILTVSWVSTMNGSINLNIY